uniref:PIN domain-containing protein n=1 Tax=Candidatus Kentrum sp. FM TaxID=2126340 RepID=A0A450S2T8_9GAMM|nr:MAG: PIN domain-containing protein [Candidatus Kentron sp. FM]VFJ45952.1 MAG: PIN domain-containing protein [Candidatus Kentron sp. FM]VFK07393.1 MAG: PIN domain-containing protein [Candidatus Kentron sp. FM]
MYFRFSEHGNRKKNRHILAMNIILDTNVIISAMRSRHGASNRLLRLLGQRNWRANLSVPLLLEYEEVCKRIMPPLGVSCDAIDEFLDYLCGVCRHRRIFYLWRPELPDADDAPVCNFFRWIAYFSMALFVSEIP